MLPDHFLVRPAADLFFDLDADAVEVNAHALQNIDGDALP